MVGKAERGRRPRGDRGAQERVPDGGLVGAAYLLANARSRRARPSPSASAWKRSTSSTCAAMTSPSVPTAPRSTRRSRKSGRPGSARFRSLLREASRSSGPPPGDRDGIALPHRIASSHSPRCSPRARRSHRARRSPCHSVSLPAAVPTALRAHSPRNSKDELGAPVIVENRAGAGGQIRPSAAEGRALNGTTYFISHDHTISILPLVVKNPGFDPAHDFVPVAVSPRSSTRWRSRPAYPGEEFQRVRRRDPRPGQTSRPSALPAPASVRSFW